MNKMAKNLLAATLSGAMLLGGTMMVNAEETADHVKLGIQMYNFAVGGDWKTIDSQEGLDELLTNIADAGYEGVEWVNFMMGGDYIDLAATKAKMDELGIESCGMHYHYDADDPEGSAKEVVERCVALDCDNLIFAWSSPSLFGLEPDEDGNYTAEQVDQWAVECTNVVNVLKKAAEGTDIQVLYHNHATEMLTGTDGSHANDMIVCDGYEIDVYWASKGLDGKLDTTLDYVKTHADDAKLLHVKDGMDGSLHTGEMCGWGKGTYDMQKIVDTAKEIEGIEWVIVENDAPNNFGTTALEDAVQSAEYAAANIDFTIAK